MALTPEQKLRLTRAPCKVVGDKHMPVGIKVYIASKYSHGNLLSNVKFQMSYANTLMGYNLTPIIPLLSHYQNTYLHRPYEDWLAHDLELIAIVDILLRMPGISPGADKEVAHARSLEIPVAHSIPELLTYLIENF